MKKSFSLLFAALMALSVVLMVPQSQRRTLGSEEPIRSILSSGGG
jgi:hypothetical protein